MEKSKITLIKVKEHYINYLSQFDKNVRFNKNEKRIYVGALLKINEIQYFAPLASPKDKHKNLSEGLTILKIKNGVLGILNLNNMIPLKEDVIIDFDINKIQDEKYKNLLLSQLRYLKNDYEKLIKQSNRLYKIINSKKQEKLNNICCNYKLLEEKLIDYIE